MSSLSAQYAELAMMCDDVELRVPDKAGIQAVGTVAAEGIHPPDYMPFSAPWSEGTSVQRADAITRWIKATHELATPDKWTLVFSVNVGGVCVGSTSLHGDKFLEKRRVSTGSWLGRKFQGQGIGKKMRQALLFLAFEGLNARLAVSEAFEDNKPSRGVNESLGYRIVGERMVVRRGSQARLIRYELNKEEWESSDAPSEIQISGLKSFKQAMQIDSF